MSGFHSRTVPSASPVASLCPSMLKATLSTSPVWPLRGWLVSGFHSRTVPSLHAGQLVPGGAKHHRVHRAAVAGEGAPIAGQLSGFPAAPWRRRRDGQLVSAGQHHRPYDAVAGQRRAEGLTAVGVPQPHRGVVARWPAARRG